MSIAEGDIGQEELSSPVQVSSANVWICRLQRAIGADGRLSASVSGSAALSSMGLFLGAAFLVFFVAMLTASGRRNRSRNRVEMVLPGG
jgi:hypothetical protein